MSNTPRFNVSLYTLFLPSTFHVALSSDEVSFMILWLEDHKSRTVNRNLNDKALERLEWFFTKAGGLTYLPARHLNRFYEQVEANAGGVDCLREPVAATVRRMKTIQRRRLPGDEIQRIRRRQLLAGV